MHYIVEVHPQGANQGCFFDVVEGLDKIREFVKASNVENGIIKIWIKKQTINPFRPDRIIKLS